MSLQCLARLRAHLWGAKAGAGALAVGFGGSAGGWRLRTTWARLFPQFSLPSLPWHPRILNGKVNWNPHKRCGSTTFSSHWQLSGAWRHRRATRVAAFTQRPDHRPPCWPLLCQLGVFVIVRTPLLYKFYSQLAYIYNTYTPPYRPRDLAAGAMAGCTAAPHHFAAVPPLIK